ncbi:MAG: site-specific integrase [Pseudonocardiaceae bacterium]
MRPRGTRTRRVAGARTRYRHAAQRRTASPRLRRHRPGQQTPSLPHRRHPRGAHGSPDGPQRPGPAQEVEERRNPRTAATLTQLLERYLDQFDGAPRTLELYRSYVRTHIGPLIGEVKVAALDAEILDSYAELRRCRDHCTAGRRGQLQHRTPGKHQCDRRCRPHTCRPLGATTIRHMHFILSGAYRRAVRWRWVSVSPLTQATPPAAPTPNPKPPSAADAARIVNHAWRDPDWGTLVWVAMTTGARRGELCALRWSHVELDPEKAVLWLRRAISHTTEGWIESDLKTHQQRRVALDPETLAVLTEHRERCQARAATLGLDLHQDAFVFSPEPDGGRFLAPSSLTQRYDRLAERLELDTTFHKLRHYSATELKVSGVALGASFGKIREPLLPATSPFGLNQGRLVEA